MQEVQLTRTRLKAGVWEGVLTGAGGQQPLLEVLHLETPVPGVSLTEMSGRPGDWAVQVPIAPEFLSDGVQTFVFRDAVSGARLGHFTIITGVPMEDDIRAEIDLLRAELDMLKRAFRRHCLDTVE
ncbi:MAG: hypothetical protein U1D06_03985 [Paracoccaceae bacterium]|nr:hypothetical protein [Paracoccaceae bacterium]